MAQRVYIVMDGNGRPVGYGTRVEAVAAADKYAQAKGGIAVLQEPDARDSEKVENPPPPPEVLPDDANRFSGLPQIILAKYGMPYLTVDMVESLSLQEALNLCRPHFPQAAKYDGVTDKLLGGQGVDLLAEDAKGSPVHSSFGLLGRNAKLAKGDSPDGRIALAFGLSLAPHQVGLRLVGKSTPRGWEPPVNFASKKFGDDQFDQKGQDVAALLSKLAGVQLDDVKSGQYTTCRMSTPDCRSSCLVHSGQNPASIEALTAKLCLTRALYAEPMAFCRLLLENLRRFFTWGACGDLDLYVRLNVFSDIVWEQVFPDLLDPIKKIALRSPDGNKESPYPRPVWDFAKRKAVQNKDAYLQRPLTGHGSFYDYTKVPARMEVYAKNLSTTHRVKPAELVEQCKSFYHLTFSFSGKNESYAKWHLERGDKVAVVFVLERLEKYKGEYVRRGAETINVGEDQAQQLLRLPRGTPREDLKVLASLLKYADTGEKDATLAKFATLKNLKIPSEPHPNERAFWAAEFASVLGYSFRETDFRISVSTDKERQLRGLYQAEWFYSFKFNSGPFAGYPVINADRNDLRAKDTLVMTRKFGKDGPALVGLDFKVAKIRIALDEYVVVMQKYSKDGKKRKGEYEELEYFQSEEEAKAALRSGKYPDDAFVRRSSEMVQVKLDLEKNAFVTPVYKEGEVFYVAQVPPQTLDGSQDVGA